MWRSFPRAVRCWAQGVRSAPSSVCQEEEAPSRPPTVRDLVPCVLGSYTRRSSGHGDDSHQWQGCDFRFQDFWARHSTQTAIGWGTAVIIGLQLTQFWQLKHRHAHRDSVENREYCPLVTVVYRLAQTLPGGHSLPQYVLGHHPWAAQDSAGSSTLLGQLQADEEAPLDTGQNVLDTGQNALDTGQNALDMGHLDDTQTQTSSWQALSRRMPLPSDLLHSYGLFGRDDNHLQFGSSTIPQHWWTPAQHSQAPPEKLEVLTNDCVANCQNDSGSVTPPLKSSVDTNSSECTSSDVDSADDHPSALAAAVNHLVELTSRYMTQVELGHSYGAARAGDVVAAIACWQQLSVSGCPSAHFNLGVCYEHGRGVVRDLEKAVKHYEEAAACGHAQASYNLACLLLQGSSMQADSLQAAMESLQKAADSGLIQAQRDLGVLYTEPKYRDLHKAAHYFNLAAQQKDASSQYYMGICYEHGWGVPRNEARAADLYARAAKAGHAEAKYNLAVFFEQGLGGLPEDMETALDLYRAAQEGGICSAKTCVQRLEDLVEQRRRQQDIQELQSWHRGLLLSRQQSRSSPTFSLPRSPPAVSQSLTSLHGYLSRNLHAALDQWESEPPQEGPVRFYIGGHDEAPDDPRLQEPRLTSIQLLDFPLVSCP